MIHDKLLSWSHHCIQYDICFYRYFMDVMSLSYIRVSCMKCSAGL